jgi:hypothetical protein
VNALSDLIARASTYGLVLSCDGHRVRVESRTDQPVPAAFRAELLARKAELLAYFGWRDEAIEIVCAAFRRLEDDYPIGFGTDALGWQQADEAITRAYWSGDLAALREALASYETVTRDQFQRSRKEERR